VALTARDMSDVDRLAQLAANPQDTTREEIYLAVASLYRVQDVHFSARERELTNDILKRLTKDVEMSIRIALAERLADDPTAPHDLILMLADDRIEVARPVILRSPLLTESDLLHLAQECGAAHREALASRPDLGEKVSDALADNENDSILIALLRNATARISPEAFASLVEKARRIECLQEPLAQRRDLPVDVAVRMCVFVSERLKSFIIHNYTIAPERLETAIAEASASVRRAPMAPSPTGSENARKLIDKMFVAGQIKAGFLVRVLQQGSIDLFELGLSRLLELSLGKTRQVLYEHGPRSVALVCRAVGIDRCVYPTVFNLSRKARAIRPAMTPDETAEVEAVFDKLTKTDALGEVRAGASDADCHG
jgi:uncharacterized protein (DUF2336 family)